MGVNFVTTDLNKFTRSSAAVYEGGPSPYINQSKNTVKLLYSGYHWEPTFCLL